MVDHCRLNENGKDSDFAVKTYTINAENRNALAEETSVLSEITFLRELKQCKNIVQIHSAYIERKGLITKYSIVINLAKHGTLL